MSDFKTLPDAPAFPETHVYHWQEKNETGAKVDHVLPRYMGGLTKREYFAGLAMQGLIAGITKFSDPNTGIIHNMPKSVAELACLYADTMIEELNK